MKLTATLLAVSDMARSCRFYCELLGMDIVCDFGANVLLSGGLSLQTLCSWQGFIGKTAAQITSENNACEVYFETNALDDFLKKLQNEPDVRLVHPVVEHAWGQRAVRFYDPDGHIIEVGEPLTAVAARFAAAGMSIAQIAAKMDVSPEYVAALLAPR